MGCKETDDLPPHQTHSQKFDYQVIYSSPTRASKMESRIVLCSVGKHVSMFKEMLTFLSILDVKSKNPHQYSYSNLG